MWDLQRQSKSLLILETTEMETLNNTWRYLGDKWEYISLAEKNRL
jgi:hypothetical protein